MAVTNFRAPWTVALAALAGVALLAGRAAAQATVGGSAFGSYVNVLGVTTQSPVATLPDTGGMAVGETDTFGVPSSIDAQWLAAVTSGAVDTAVSSAQSTSELENVSILNGLITADNVTAIASSDRNATGVESGSDGSGFVNLVVTGVPMASDVAPNTQLPLPGVGYVVLNEQQITGDGVSSSGITVNMIHVILQDVLTGLTTGEIIVGSAKSAVGS